MVVGLRKKERQHFFDVKELDEADAAILGLQRLPQDVKL